MSNFTFFCFTCKRHVSFSAQSEKDAKQEFNKHGHDDDKVSRLRRGLVGK